MAKIRVLLVDDHMVVRIGLQALIDSEPGMEVVGQAGNGVEAIEQTEQAAPRRDRHGHLHAGDGRPGGHTPHPR